MIQAPAPNPDIELMMFHAFLSILGIALQKLDPS